MEKMLRLRKPTLGFSLIELLVVITIITLLVGFLFPVFVTARENVRKMACVSNMRQLGIAVSQYTQDYDEMLPFWNAAFLTQPTSLRTPNKLWQNVISPYTGRCSAIWHCASGSAWKDGVRSAPVPVTSPSSISYGMNMFIAYDYAHPKSKRESSYRPGLHLAELHTPSRTILLGESGGSARIDTPIQRRWLWYTTKYKDFRIQTWERRDIHSGGANYLFGDMHVAFKRAEVIYPASLQEAHKSALAYFAATDADEAWLTQNPPKPK